MIQFVNKILFSLLIFVSSLAFADSYGDLKAEAEAFKEKAEMVFAPNHFETEDVVKKTAQDFMFLYVKISSSGLSDKQKSELLSGLATHFGEQFEKFTVPYTDVAKLPPDSSIGQKVINRIQRFFLGGARDMLSIAATVISPFGGRIEGINPIQDDYKRGKRVQWALGKMTGILKDALNDRTAALQGSGLFKHLELMTEKLQNAEPNKWGAQTRTMHTLYGLVTFWAMLDAWDPFGFVASMGGLLGAPTEMHILISVVLVIPILSATINAIRHYNSGGPVRRATRKLVSALKRYNKKTPRPNQFPQQDMQEAMSLLASGLSLSCEAPFNSL